MAFSENNQVVTVLAPDADRFAATKNTDVVGLGKYNRATFHISIGAGTTGTTVCTLEECDDFTPSNSTAIAFKYKAATTVGTYGAWQDATATGFTVAAGSDDDYIIEITAGELADGFPNVRLTFVEGVDAPIDGSVICILSEPRYHAPTMEDGLS